jgi:N-acetylmuramoyl-L-alanine amidase
VRRPYLSLVVAPLGVALLALAVMTSGGPPPRRPPPIAPIAGRRPVPQAPLGTLSGLVVYLSAGHGWLLHRVRHDGDPIAWGRQRDHRFGMVEDDWTASFVADALAPALEAEGATVLALRERDRNPLAEVIDDGDPAFSAFGASARRERALAEGGADRQLAPGGSATWSSSAPTDGHWYAYARWTEDAAQDEQAIYTIVAGDEVREVVVDQRHHGGHWWPLGDFCLPAGAPVEVTLTGSGRAPLSADAVRLGGGTFRIVLPWSFEVQEQPYWAVAMPHQIERLGGPGDFDAYTCGNAVSDMRLRPHWATWASANDEEAVYLSIHTNASPRGRAKGLTVFYGIDRDPPTPADPESVRLSALLEASIHGRVSARDPGYRTRGVEPGNYSEISPVHNGLPASLLELGFHTDREDAARMQTRRFQEDAAAGIVEGLSAWRAGVPAGVGLPLVPPGWSEDEGWVLLE